MGDTAKNRAVLLTTDLAITIQPHLSNTVGEKNNNIRPCPHLRNLALTKCTGLRGMGRIIISCLLSLWEGATERSALPAQHTQRFTYFKVYTCFFFFLTFLAEILLDKIIHYRGIRGEMLNLVGKINLKFIQSCSVHQEHFSTAHSMHTVKGCFLWSHVCMFLCKA